MDFLSRSAKADLVSGFTLVFESTSFEKKTMKYFVSGFGKNVLSTLKREGSFDVLYFEAKPFLFSLHDLYNFFLQLNIPKTDQVLSLCSHVIFTL